MAGVSVPSSAIFSPSSSSLGFNKHGLVSLFPQRHHQKASSKSVAFRLRAAKIPDGVVVPKVVPKFKPPVIGFTTTAEIWNSRACMIGLIGTFIVELILNKGILQVIGVDVGKGLDIPL